MIINGQGPDFCVELPEDRRTITDAIAAHLRSQPILAGDHVVSALAAAAVVDYLEGELADARAYRWLRGQIRHTMADPSDWDGEDAEHVLLSDYVDHLAHAGFGDCERCGQPIPATEQFTLAGMTGGMYPMPIPVCRRCL